MAGARARRLLRIAVPLPAAATRATLALAVLAGALWWGGPRALTSVGEFLTVDDNPARADAIVVLSGGGARLELGVELYQKGHAPLLILTGAGEEGNPPAAEVMRTQATALGVPASAVLLVSNSTSTREDALYTRDLMARRGLGSAILVTSPYHQRRAALTFARVFEGSGITVASSPVREGRWRPDTWWQDGHTLRITVVELVKLAYYRLVGYL